MHKIITISILVLLPRAITAGGPANEHSPLDFRDQLNDQLGLADSRPMDHQPPMSHAVKQYLTDINENKATATTVMLLGSQGDWRPQVVEALMRVMTGKIQINDEAKYFAAYDLVFTLPLEKVTPTVQEALLFAAMNGPGKVRRLILGAIRTSQTFWDKDESKFTNEGKFTKLYKDDVYSGRLIFNPDSTLVREVLRASERAQTSP